MYQDHISDNLFDQEGNQKIHIDEPGHQTCVYEEDWLRNTNNQKPVNESNQGRYGVKVHTVFCGGVRVWEDDL